MGFAAVSILGMLEGVLKAYTGGNPLLVKFCFNPWYVGGGVKSVQDDDEIVTSTTVSILGMLEGVLKV